MDQTPANPPPKMDREPGISMLEAGEREGAHGGSRDSFREAGVAVMRCAEGGLDKPPATTSWHDPVDIR